MLKNSMRPPWFTHYTIKQGNWGWFSDCLANTICCRSIRPGGNGEKTGVGSKLIKTGIEILKKSKCPFTIVLGHPEYYPRFGFEPASRYRITSQWEGVPDHAFMILWLDKSRINDVSGIAKYRDEFNEAT